MPVMGPARPDRAEELFVREAGQGPPLLLLHGLASSSRYWEPHFATVGRSYRAIAPDLLGFGRSPKPRASAYGPDEHLAALSRSVVPRLDRPVTLVGHSMGAVLALHLAVTRPELVERLILVSLPVLGRHAAGHTTEGRSRRFHAFAVHSAQGRALCGIGLRVLRPLALALYPHLRPDLPRGAARDALRADWTAYWRTLERVVFDSDVPALFAAAPGPFTVLHGAGDIVAPVEPVRALVRTRPDVQYTEVATGHNPCFTCSTAFYEALMVPVPAAAASTASDARVPALRQRTSRTGRLIARIAPTR